MRRRIYTDADKAEVSQLTDPNVDEAWADDYILREAAKIREGWDEREEQRRRGVVPETPVETHVVSEGHYLINGRHGVRR